MSVTSNPTLDLAAVFAHNRATFGDLRMEEPTPVVEPVVAPVVEPVVEPVKADEKDPAAEAAKWKALARKHEEQSKANADKAKQFDALEEANRSELEKATARAEAAEKKAAETEARTLRLEVAGEKGVPAALISGSTKEDLEASADALLAFRGEKPKPDFGGGDRGGDTTGKPQLSDAEVKRLYAERKYEEIDQARQDGRLTDLLSGKQ